MWTGDVITGIIITVLLIIAMARRSASDRDGPRWPSDRERGH